MNQYYVAGFLAIVFGVRVLFLSYRQYKTQKSISLQIMTVCLGLCMLTIGCIGIYKETYDGINLLLTGISGCWLMKKSEVPDGGVFVNMHYRGWIAVIFAVIAGIIRILEDLHVLE